MRTNFKPTRLALLVSSALAISSTVPTYAQEATGLTLEEIVVTAQKREEGLQDTPIAVSAFTTQALANKGIDNISKLAQFTPNLVFDTTSPVSGASSGAVVFIRGIGNTDFSLTTDPGVGTYVDGVYVSRSVGGVLDVLDVERIEVLRGPQGTLFGRNTIGGALNITSRKPSEEFEGSVEVTAGNFDRFDVRASVDIPFTEKFRGNFAVSTKNRDGFVDRELDGVELGDEEKVSFRGNFVYEVNDNLDFQFSYDRTEIDEESAGSVLLGLTGNNPIVDGVPLVAPATSSQSFVNANNIPAGIVPFGTGGAAIPGLPVDLSNALVAGDFDTFNSLLPDGDDDTSFGTGLSGTDLDIQGFSFTANWRLNDNISFKYTGAYRETEGSFNRDADGLPIAITETRNDNYEHEQISHEIQFIGDFFDGKLQIVAGLYDFDEEGTDDVLVNVFAPAGPPPVTDAPVLINNNADVDNQSEAAYAQITYNVTENFSLTGGIRYTEDTKRFDFNQFVSAPDGGPLPVPPPPLGPAADIAANGVLVPGFVPLVGTGSGTIEETFDDTSYKFGADFTFNDGTLLYYSYSEGFKSGGFALRYVAPVDEPITFTPEFLETHEIGVKWQGWNDRIRLNAAVYTSDYDDVQVTFFDAGGGPITANAGVASIEGLEIELTALLSKNFLLEAGYGYTDAEYDSITPVAGLSLTIDEDASLVNTPENTFNISGEYSLPLASGDELAFRLDYRFTDDIFNDAQNSPFLFQDSFDLWNASIRYVSADEKWSVKAFVDNISDERYIESGDSNFGLGFHEGNFNRPREYGVTVKYNF